MSKDKNSPINMEKALHEMEGDKELLLRLVWDFSTNMEEQLEELEKWLKAEDLVSVSNEAHKIKGGSGLLRVESLSEAASALEQSAKENDPVKSKEDIKKLKQEHQRLSAFIMENIDL